MVVGVAWKSVAVFGVIFWHFNMRPWACSFKMIIGWFGFVLLLKRKATVTASHVLFPLESASCGGGCWHRSQTGFPLWLTQKQVLLEVVSWVAIKQHILKFASISLLKAFVLALGDVTFSVSPQG